MVMWCSGHVGERGHLYLIDSTQSRASTQGLYLSNALHPIKHVRLLGVTVIMITESRRRGAIRRVRVV